MSGAAYVEAVQERYLALRGGGLTLSPIDADRIRAWRDRGVPLELALLGLERAHGERSLAGRGARARPLSLRTAEAHVLALFEGYARRSGALPSSGGAAPRSTVAAGLAALAGEVTGPARAAYAEALLLLDRAGELTDDALGAADEAQALTYLRAISRVEQREIARIVRREAGPRRGVPRAAHRATLRTLLFEAARQHGGLRRPSDLP